MLINGKRRCSKCGSTNLNRQRRLKKIYCQNPTCKHVDPLVYDDMAYGTSKEQTLDPQPMYDLIRSYRVGPNKAKHLTREIFQILGHDLHINHDGTANTIKAYQAIRG